MNEAYLAEMKLVLERHLNRPVDADEVLRVAVAYDEYMDAKIGGEASLRDWMNSDA